MNNFVFGEDFIEEGVDSMRLIGVHVPSRREFKLLGLEFVPTGPLNHELSCNPVPSLLPIDPRVVDNHSHVVNAGVVADQSKPTACHRSKLVFVLDETVIVELILVHRPLKVKGNRIVGPELLQWDYAFIDSFNLYLTFQMALE
jgi:hypothetical protein